MFNRLDDNFFQILNSAFKKNNSIKFTFNLENLKSVVEILKYHTSWINF